MIERQLAVEDVAAGQSVAAFEIERRDDLTRNDRGAEPRGVLLDRACRRRRQTLALVVPCRHAQMIWRVLHVRRHDVLAGRRQARIGNRRGGQLDPRLRRPGPVLASAIDGTPGSIHGSSAKPPYLAASNARSMASMSAARRTRPESAALFWSGARRVRPAKRGSAETA